MNKYTFGLWDKRSPKIWEYWDEETFDNLDDVKKALIYCYPHRAIIKEGDPHTLDISELLMRTGFHLHPFEVTILMEEQTNDR